MSLVNWKRVTMPKTNWGLGIKDFDLLNQSFWERWLGTLFLILNLYGCKFSDRNTLQQYLMGSQELLRIIL